MQGHALVVRSTIHSAWLSEVLPAPKRGYSGFVLSKYCTASSPAKPLNCSDISLLEGKHTQRHAVLKISEGALPLFIQPQTVTQGKRSTVGPCVDHVAAQQDHHAVEEAEAEGRGRVDGGADSHPCLHQALHHAHHLRRPAPHAGIAGSSDVWTPESSLECLY